MTRSRTVASVIAVAALLVIVLAGARIAVPYTIFQPGPTIDVLGKLDGHQILEVTGHRTYPDDGQLRMVTIILSQPQERVSAWSAMYSWLDPKDAVYPTRAIFPAKESNAESKAQDAEMMASSQDNAVAAALRLAGIRYTERPRIVSVDKDAPAAGKLRTGDVVTAVDGIATPSTRKLIQLVRARKPGTRIEITFTRASTSRVASLRTTTAGTTPALRTRSRVGVGISPDYEFPFKVKVNISRQIGGPSAGMMFALSIYDLLTPGSLTGGESVAGTGTIVPDGTVGPIGGVDQKIAGAQSDGAKLFLVPAGDCDEAVHADYDPDKMRLAKVSTLKGALGVIGRWVANPRASLPECS